MPLPFQDLEFTFLVSMSSHCVSHVHTESGSGSRRSKDLRFELLGRSKDGIRGLRRAAGHVRADCCVLALLGAVHSVGRAGHGRLPAPPQGGGDQEHCVEMDGRQRRPCPAGVPNRCLAAPLHGNSSLQHLVTMKFLIL
jgi:hypothetical protein